MAFVATAMAVFKKMIEELDIKYIFNHFLNTAIAVATKAIISQIWIQINWI